MNHNAYNPGEFDRSNLFVHEIEQENLSTSYTGCDIFSCYAAGTLVSIDSEGDLSDF